MQLKAYTEGIWKLQNTSS